MKTAAFDLMAEKSSSSFSSPPPSSPPPSSPPPSSPSKLNGRIGGTRPKHPTGQSPPPGPHNGCVPAGAGRSSPGGTDLGPKPGPDSSGAEGGGVSICGPRPAPGRTRTPEGSGRPRGKSLSSCVDSVGSSPGPRPRVGTAGSSPRIMGLWNKARSSQKEETSRPAGWSPRVVAVRPDSAVFSSQAEELLELIVESQSQRLNDQRASLSLVPDPALAALSGPGRLCGACCLELRPHAPSQEFYNMLIQYQSSRIEDQRCSLPDLDEVVGSIPEGQEDFFSLLQRVQARRMDGQRAPPLAPDPTTRLDPASNQAPGGAASNPPSSRARSSPRY